MTLANNFFKYIIIRGDEYILADNTPNKIILQIRDYIDNVKKLYGDDIKIRQKNNLRRK